MRKMFNEKKKIHNFWGHVDNVSAKKEAMVAVSSLWQDAA